MDDRRWPLRRRDGTKVRFLELFFDLVFVLAFTQCTTLMVHQPTWPGLAHGLLVLAVLWWAWGGYAWLTSAIDPEEGPVRIVMFGAMGALLVVALAVPEAFGERALLFVVAYALVRAAQLVLFALAGREDPALRRSVGSLAVSSAIGIGLLTAASFFDGPVQAGFWVVAIVIDFGGPALFGVAGWRIVPAHFAERYGLIIILALGESIVVLGVGAEAGYTAGVVTAVVLGVAISAALWWTYFDVVAIVTEQRMSALTDQRRRNAFARDSYSYLHLPMAAGIVLVAVGLEKTVEHVDDPLGTVPAAALLGGTALYLLAHVALRLRNARSLSYPRLVVATLLVAAVPAAAGELPALVTLGGATAMLWVLIGYETARYGDARARLRRAHSQAAPHHPPTGGAPANGG